MESSNVLVPLAKECRDLEFVSDEMWAKAESAFRILGGTWVSNTNEELAAFKEIMDIKNGRFKKVKGYW